MKGQLVVFIGAFLIVASLVVGFAPPTITSSRIHGWHGMDEGNDRGSSSARRSTTKTIKIQQQFPLTVSPLRSYYTKTTIDRPTSTAGKSTTTRKKKPSTAWKPPPYYDDSSTRVKDRVLERIPWTQNVEKYGPFHQHETWAYSTNTEDACSSFLCTNIEGTIPADLCGTYYKNGPGRFERGTGSKKQQYKHVLDGDGFVTAFHFDGMTNTIRYTGRFVETEYFKKEQATDEVLYRNVFGTQRKGGILSNAFDMDLKNAANTNVVEFGGRLLAFWEAGRPYELDPVSLETKPLPVDFDDRLYSFFQDLGGCCPSCGTKDGTHSRPTTMQDRCLGRAVTFDMGGPVDKLMNLGLSFTAHPHIIDHGDTLVGFRSGNHPITKDTIMEFVEYDKDWTLRPGSPVRYTFSTGSPPHDFAISEDYYCFYQNRFEMDNMEFLLGLKAPTEVIRLLLKKPTILHVVPRYGGNKSHTFYVPPFFNLHMVADVQQDGNTLTVYSNGWDLTDERYFPQTANSVPLQDSWDFTKLPPTLLYRTVVDLDSGTLIRHEQVLDGLVMEFPTQDIENPNIMYFGVSSTEYAPLPPVGTCKMDVTDPDDVKTEYWWAENKIFTSELTPVRKRNGDPGSWLLTILSDSGSEAKRSSVAIFDSERFGDGPVARIHLPHYLSYSLHGSFALSSEVSPGFQ